jgi:hypothetical protein
MAGQFSIRILSRHTTTTSTTCNRQEGRWMKFEQTKSSPCSTRSSKLWLTLLLAMKFRCACCVYSSLRLHHWATNVPPWMHGGASHIILFDDHVERSGIRSTSSTKMTRKQEQTRTSYSVVSTNNSTRIHTEKNRRCFTIASSSTNRNKGQAHTSALQ